MADSLPTEPDRYHLIIIGGGINGAAIAREAALLNQRVLLLEQSDFGSGTSAASTRLIHGGLRYLEYAEFGLVRESLAERERLLSLAPHLVAPLKLLLPIYERSRRRPWQIRAGMWLYDLLSYDKSLPGHSMLSRRELLEASPGLADEGLLAGATYYDAQIRYPERLVIEILRDAVANGAVVENYARVTRVMVEGGKVSGVEWGREGNTQAAHASTIVNATGPWLDGLLGGIAPRPLLGGTKGSHLIASPFPGAPTTAVYAEAMSDGRPFFVIPWNDLYLIGTTDQHDDGDPGASTISREEFDYLVKETQNLFPAATGLARQVCFTHAGIRPLPRSNADRPGAITRRHLIRHHRSARGLYSIVGGKLTTHRALAVDVMRRLRRRLDIARGSPTEARRLPGALDVSELGEFMARLSGQLGETQAKRLWQVYGAQAAELADAMAGSTELATPIGTHPQIYVAELVLAHEKEWSRTLSDLMQRRCMRGLDADFGFGSVGEVAEWMRRLGIWDESRAGVELEAFRAQAKRFGVPGSDSFPPSQS